MISLGLPVHNGEKYIKKAIDSILSQSFQDFELLISDNASTDNTSEICLAYVAADSRVKYYRQINNIGAFNNFKFVLSWAQGIHFMWIAADDMFGTVDFLSQLYKEMSEHVDYAFPEVNIVDSTDTTISRNVMDPLSGCTEKREFARASLVINSHQIYGLFKRQVLLEDFQYLERMKGLRNYNEGLFVHAISTQRNGVYVKKALKIYRQHPENTSNSTSIRRAVPDFIKYSLNSSMFFISTKQLALIDKIKIVLLLNLRHARHFLHILGSYKFFG